MKKLICMLLSIGILISCFSCPVLADNTYAVVPIYETVTVNEESRLLNYASTDNYASIAVAIWLMYMDKAVNESYVESSLEDETSLIQEIKIWLNDSGQSISAANLKNGLQDYLDDQGVNHTVYGGAWNATQYRNKINIDRPVLVRLNSHPKYGSRWVVGYGYIYSTQTDTLSTIIVNDCSGNKGVEINLSYVGYIVY